MKSPAKYRKITCSLAFREFQNLEVERPFVYIFFLNWKTKYYVSIFRKFVTTVTSSFVTQNTVLIAAEIKSKSITVES